MGDPRMVDDVLDEITGVVLFTAVDHVLMGVDAAEHIAREVLLALADRGWGPVR